MPIEAVIFDIGDVLEVNPRTGWPQRWATRLRMDIASLERSLDEIWGPGSIGSSSLEEIEEQTAAALGLDPTALAALRTMPGRSTSARSTGSWRTTSCLCAAAARRAS